MAIGYRIEDLEQVFTYHPPDDVQKVNYEKIRAGAKVFAQVLLESTPGCPDQTAAMRKLREAVMTANSAVALKGRF